MKLTKLLLDFWGRIMYSSLKKGRGGTTKLTSSNKSKGTSHCRDRNIRKITNGQDGRGVRVITVQRLEIMRGVMRGGVQRHSPA